MCLAHAHGSLSLADKQVSTRVLSRVHIKDKQNLRIIPIMAFVLWCMHTHVKQFWHWMYTWNSWLHTAFILSWYQGEVFLFSCLLSINEQLSRKAWQRPNSLAKTHLDENSWDKLGKAKKKCFPYKLMSVNIIDNQKCSSRAKPFFLQNSCGTQWWLDCKEHDLS